MGRIFLFMGIQGAGKGTQASRLSEKLHIPQISTGDIFRAIMKEESPLGDELRAILNSGALVSDEFTSRMVRERISQPDAKPGFILDGYPRTQGQVEHLDQMLTERGESIGAVLFFDLTKEEAIERLAHRRVCTANSNHIYHLKHNPPKQDGICDIDGAPLKQRDDDKPEAIEKRISEYINQTFPVVDAYKDRGIFHKIDARDSIDDVTETMMKIVNQ
jgi:adenylate kinase